MERESRGENFVKRIRLNIVASSVAAISIAAAGVAEKSGSFDPLTNSADSASHLVLNTPHKTYEQLIDSLPEVESAQAAAGITATCFHSFWSGAGYNCDHAVAVNNHIAINTEDAFFFDHICHANVTAVDTTYIIANIVQFDVFDYNCDTFGNPPNNPVTIDVCNFGAMVAEIRVAGAICSPGSVGGVSEAPDLNKLNKNLDANNKDNTLPIAAGVAVGAISAAGAAFYINRRRSS